MDRDENSRRDFLKNATLLVGSAFVLNACTGGSQPMANNQSSAANQGGKIGR